MNIKGNEIGRKKSKNEFGNTTIPSAYNFVLYYTGFQFNFWFGFVPNTWSPLVSLLKIWNHSVNIISAFEVNNLYCVCVGGGRDKDSECLYVSACRIPNDSKSGDSFFYIFTQEKWRWPCCLGNIPAAARLLGSGVCIPLILFMFISFVFRVMCRKRALRRTDPSFTGVLAAGLV